jgi:hypothetical protein
VLFRRAEITPSYDAKLELQKSNPKVERRNSFEMQTSEIEKNEQTPAIQTSGMELSDQNIGIQTSEIEKNEKTSAIQTSEMEQSGQKSGIPTSSTPEKKNQIALLQSLQRLFAFLSYKISSPTTPPALLLQSMPSHFALGHQQVCIGNLKILNLFFNYTFLLFFIYIHLYSFIFIYIHLYSFIQLSLSFSFSFIFKICVDRMQENMLNISSILLMKWEKKKHHRVRCK